MLNKWTGIGRLGKDPELKYLPAGTAICNFSIACESSYKSGDEWKKQTFWADIVMFGKRAESIAKHLSKGSLVYVEGRLQTRSWDTAGGKQYRTEIIGDDIKFLDSKTKNAQQKTGEELPLEESPEEITDLEPF